MHRRIPRLVCCLLLPLALACTANAQSYELIKIDAAPAKGFNYAYFLTVPAQVGQPPVLLVEPNNTGTTNDDQAVHEAAARQTAIWRATDYYLSALKCPILVPTFPRPSSNWRMYTQALDRDTLLTQDPMLKRIDLQLVAMIDDAKAQLAARGVTVDSKVFLFGFSAGGTFTNRFAILQPEVVRAASCGGVSLPTVPLAEYKGKQLPYPTGIADLEQLTGRPFQAEAFRRVPMMIFRGDQDTNDEVAYSDGFDDWERELIYELFGGPPPFLRYRIVEGLYNAVTSLCRMVIMPNVAHSWGVMQSATVEFFERYRTDPAPPMTAKPLSYRLYFPHVDVLPPWVTRVGLVSNLDGVPISGVLEAYAADGRGPLESVPVILPSLGRRLLGVADVFSNPDQVAYAVFVSDSGFLGGYTQFTQDGSSVTIPAMGGATEGMFPNAGSGGWSGLVFVNVTSAPVTVTIEACSDAGSRTAETELSLLAGQKIVGTSSAIFGSHPPGTSHYRFRATGKVVAFCLNGARDCSVLDGIPHGIPPYIYQ